MRRRQTGVRGVVTFALVLGAILVPATPSAAAEVFSDGFESGNLSQWTSTISFTAQSAIVRTGGFAGRATTATNDANASKTLAAVQSDFYLRSFVNVVSHTGSTPIMRVRTATGAVILTVNVNATEKLATNNAVTGVNRQSTITVTPGFHEIQVHTLINGTSGVVEVWYDGVLVSALSNTAENLGTNPVGRFVLGRSGTSANPMDVAYDDVVASTTFIGGGGGSAPATPTNLRTTLVQSNRVDLEWNASTGATSYNVRRTGGAGGTVTVNRTTTIYSDTTVAPNTSYQYTVDACNANGCSNQSAALAVLTPPGGGGASTVVMAAGDIACDPADANFNNGNGSASKCRQKFTGQLLSGADHVLPLGDTQYECAGLTAYNQSYHPTGWGAAKSISHPILSDEDYDTVGTNCGAAGPDGYNTYFGPQALGDYYKIDDAASSWRFIGLNSECSKVPGGCAEGSAQNNFLESNLVPSQCTIAMLHKPYLRSKANGAQVTAAMLPFWQDLTARDAEIVLGGDSHFYERFNPTDVNGNFQMGGTVQFVVGVGGKSRGGLAAVGARHPQHAKGTAATFGVLKLTLHPGSYDWEFVVEGSNSFTDTGSANC